MKNYPSAFEELWAAYPKRPNNPKMLAFKAYRQRLLQGMTSLELLDAVKEYASQMQRAGKIGTEFVMQARTFLGPNERWREFSASAGGNASRENTGRPPGGSRAPESRPPAEELIDARQFLRGLIDKLSGGKSL